MDSSYPGYVQLIQLAVNDKTSYPAGKQPQGRYRKKLVLAPFPASRKRLAYAPCGKAASRPLQKEAS